MKQTIKLRIFNGDTGMCLAREATLGNTFALRLRGLLGKRKLEQEKEGFVLFPCRAVHTLGMLFPLDLLFVGKSGEVLKALPSFKPWRFSPSVRGSRYVIELPAGTIAASRTEEGHRLVMLINP